MCNNLTILRRIKIRTIENLEPQAMNKNATLLLDDGTCFKGNLFGYDGIAVGEVVFNTAMTGYQEILSDPSYAGQIICLTSSHIGNTGTNTVDQESDKIYAAGLIMRSATRDPSSWRNQSSLEEWLIANHLTAICDIDTRRLTRHLRTHGSCNGVIYGAATSQADAQAALQGFAGLKGADLASEVSVSKAYRWNSGRWNLQNNQTESGSLTYRVIAYDYGIKRAILSELVEHGCDVQVIPARTSAKKVLSLKPDGIFLSNGPGDPQPCDYAIQAIQELLEENIPLFGICLGHQLLSLACGAQTTKMKFGHHGANHPVLDLASKKVMITSQNHNFCVAEDSLPATLRPTHRSLFDGSLQGVEHTEKPAFGFQGHPEASPGPHDIKPLFQRFSAMMQQHKG